MGPPSPCRGGGLSEDAVAGRDDSTFQRAVAALQAGQAEDSERLFRSLLANEPRHVGGLNLFGILLMKLRRYPEAERIISRALQEDSTSDVTFYNHALVLKALKRPAQALEQLNRAIAINGAVAETWNNRGTVLNDLSRYQDAIADFDRAIAINANYAEAVCNKGKSLTELKRFDHALAAYDQALALNRNLAEAWVGRGTALVELKRKDEALAAYEQALALRADLAEALVGIGNLQTLQHAHDQAKMRYDRALQLNPDLAEAWLGRGNVEVAQEHYGEALQAYDRALALKPELAEAWLGRGNALAGQRMHERACEAYDRALALAPELAGAWLGRGGSLAELGCHQESLAAHDRALAIDPANAEVWIGRGNLLAKLKRSEDAFASFDRATAAAPDSAGAWVSLGHALAALKRYDEARAAYDRALALDGASTEAYLGRGNVAVELNRHQAAAEAFDKALALKPRLAAAWLGRGNLFVALGRRSEALAAYQQALAIDPRLAEAWFALGNLHSLSGNSQDAFTAYDKALNIAPHLKFVEGARILMKIKMCDWTDLEAETAHLLAGIRTGHTICVPYCTLSLPASPADQLQAAENFVADRVAVADPWRPDVLRHHQRLRIAYLSADFRDHAVMHLAAALFEQHDRSRFEVTAFSLGPDQDSDMRRRLKDAFEHFVDATELSDEEIAGLIRQRQIDILIDMNGYTEGFRMNILAQRPAPVQVSFLGYSGTMGAGYIDYIVGDSTIIPQDDRGCYAEQVLWLPNSFLPYDASVRISETPTRQACGLPEAGFVFCCFNNSYKLGPKLFRIWMDLLKATDGGVLWLAEFAPLVVANLRREAEQCGVAPERLIFAPRVPALADHLARYRLADLFLDTLPYNAHTTAADALWTGLPVLTCLGATFAGRVGASILHAVGLPELITASLDDYEALALKLAREPALLASLKDKLARNRSTCPLFDTRRYTRALEAAYITMWQRHQNGEPPQHFAVGDADGSA